MKAILYRDYGSPDVLKYEEVDKPVAKDNEVLIRIRAASTGPHDWHFMRGLPYLVRMVSGMPKPKNPRLGADAAGQVEAVGRNVTQFKPGDEVFGTCRGSFAEYACAPESSLAMKPENLTSEQAACVPISAITALQGLRDKGQIQAGQKVLINGAAGGVGTFAVQIAKTFGADVTGVCSAKNVEMIRGLGAARVIDYKLEDFTKGSQRYDLILDCVGNRPLSASRRVMNPKGKYVVVGGPDGRWIGGLSLGLKAIMLSPLVSQDLVMFLAKVNQKDLTVMQEFMKSGKVTPVIDSRYPLSEVAAAIRHLEAGHARGKVVITVAG